MTITSDVTAVQIPGNGGATVFAVPMKIFAATDLVVGFIVSGLYVEQTSGYSVTNIDINGGCTITFTTPPPSNVIVDIRTDTPLTQGTEFANLGAYLPENTTDTCDRIVRIVQDLARKTYDYGIHGPDNETTPWPALASASVRAGMTQMWDSTGLPTIGTPVAGTITGQIIISLLTANLLGSLLFPITADESNAGVSPVSLAFPPGDVRRYGADPTGVADSAAAFATAFLLKGVIRAVGSFKLNSGVTMNIVTTSLIGPATITSGLAANGGALLTITDGASGAPDPNQIHCLDQIQFVGQGLTGVQAVVFNGTTYDAGNTTIFRCTFSSFATGVWIKANSWEVECISCSFSSCGGDNAALYVSFQGSERNAVSNSAFYNCTECVRLINGGSIYLNNCSLDYSFRLINIPSGSNGGTLFCTQCYFENNLDTDYWFNVGTAGLLKFNQCHIVQTGPKPLFPWGQSTAGYGGGIFFDGCKFDREGTGLDSVLIPMISGSGNAGARNSLVFGFSANSNGWSTISTAQNACFNGTFANTSGWTLANAGAGLIPTVASNTLSFQQNTAGLGFGQSAQFVNIPAKPGDNFGFTMMVKTNDQSHTTFALNVFALGQDGSTVLATAAAVGGLNFFNPANPMPTTYTQAHQHIYNLPAGTAFVQVQLSFGNTALATTIVQAQTVVMNLF